MIENEAELERALELLASRQSAPTTVAALREGGVAAPAQAVYMLQLAGYLIDRVKCTRADGKRTMGYRFSGRRAPAFDTSAL